MEDSRNVVEAGTNGMPAGSETIPGTAAGNDAGAGRTVPEAVSETWMTGTAGTVPEMPAEAAGAAPVNGIQAGAAPEAVKNPGIKKKIPGVLELLIGAGLAVLAGWMFYNTRGTRLLYVDVDFGRMCKYYWAPAAGALVFFAVGLFTLKRAGREVKKDGKLE